MTPFVFLTAALAVAAAGLPSLSNSSTQNGAPTPEAFGFFANNPIYEQKRWERLEYPRYVELQDGSILVTSQMTGDGQGFFPVFKSTDGGATWKWISNIEDQENGWGLGAQPCLLELTDDFGDYEAGTILAAGNSASGSGTHIDLYASTDGAESWDFVSNIAVGGAPVPENGFTPVWEPYLL